MAAPDERARYIDGLRVLAAALEQHPEIPLPDTTQEIRFCFFGPDEREAMAAAAQAIPCAWRKEFGDADPDGRWPAFFWLHGELGGLRVKMSALRDTVCRRVVTGTRKVTEEVPDPEALKAVPKKTVTRLIEDIEWDCGSLLAPVTARPKAALSAAGGEL